MAALPYWQLYVADYLADTIYLDVVESGAYLHLLMNYWQTGKPLPNDDRKLAIIAKCDTEQWLNVRSTVVAYFVEQDGELHHDRVEADLEKVRKKSKQASDAGKKSAAKRRKQKKKGKSNARLTPVENPLNHTDTDTDTDTEFPTDSNEVRLSKLLYSLIKKRSPGHKEPDYQKWGKHIDRMIRLDGRDPQVVANVIGWCQGDDFWQNNILSTNKLRDQFDQLFLKMSDDTGDGIAQDCAPECFSYGTCKARGKLKDGPCGAFTGPQS